MTVTRKKTQLGITFGQVLKAARAAQGLTQEELAAAIDYSRVQIAYLESGFRTPSLEALLVLEPALQLNPGELVRQTAEIRNAPRGKTRR